MRNPNIDELVDGIRQLTPAKRRQLLRRLRINGLLDFDEPLTDYDALNVSTALGVAYSDYAARQRAVASSQIHSSSQRENESAQLDHQAIPSEEAIDTAQVKALEEENVASPEPTRIDLTQGKHLAPSSGKVVVGAPTPSQEKAEPSDDPHAMAPVPGQGPRGVIRLIFDGGSKGNPGYGYGSYALEWPGLEPQVVRLQHGNSVTNNEAEYDTLVKALDAILKRLHAMGAEPSTATLDIRGDSLLVINQVIGEWKCKKDRLKRRRDKIRAMLDQFDYWELRHHDRENSVRILGH